MRVSVFCVALAGAFLAFMWPVGSAAETRGTHIDATPSELHTELHRPLPAARVTTAISDFDHWLDQLALANGTAGLATAIVVNGKVRYERTLGYADADTGARVKPNTVFRIASLSKAFATALTGILVRQDALGWDTRLAQVLPFFKLKDADASRQATVRDLLSQSVGLPYHAYDNLLSLGVPFRKLERKLATVPLTCAPGDCYGYQNVAFSMIGDVIHAKTGQFFIQLVDKYLFVPLGMTTASYGLDGLEGSRSWARPHRQRRGQWVAYQPNDNFYVAPAAGVNASIRDVEQWLIAQMGGRPMVLPGSLLAQLHTPIIDTPGERYGSDWRRKRVKHAAYALGWRVYDYAGTTLVFHAGAVQGYRAMIGFLPEYHAGVAVLWNCEDHAPAGLMPMLFDAMLDLPHQDWAGLERSLRASAGHAAKHQRPATARN